MQAHYFQHQNAVVMHVETVHRDGRLTLTREPGSKPFITCAQSAKPRPGYARLIPDPPPPPPAPTLPPEDTPEE